ncbi:MAG: hypothetical protein ACRD38_08385, partial [Nitrososphaerales archaeon]
MVAIIVFGADSALGVTTISNTIISGVTAFISSAADPADAGVLRLGNTETVCWEASPAATTEPCISADANEDVLFGTDVNNINLNSNPLTNAVLGGSLNANGQTVTALSSLASNSSPAGSGFVRLGNAETICWEQSPAGNDV